MLLYRLGFYYFISVLLGYYFSFQFTNLWIYMDSFSISNMALFSVFIALIFIPFSYFHYLGNHCLKGVKNKPLNLVYKFFIARVLAFSINFFMVMLLLVPIGVFTANLFDLIYSADLSIWTVGLNPNLDLINQLESLDYDSIFYGCYFNDILFSQVYYLVLYFTLFMFYFVYLKVRYSDKIEPKYIKLVKDSLDDKKSDTEKGLSDIDKEIDLYSDTKEYDPIEYMDKAVAENNIFIGLDENNNPITIPYNHGNGFIFVETMSSIVGATRTGKGIVSGVICSQAHKLGSGIVVFDPKQGGDGFAPDVFYKASLETGKKFHYIDLTQDIPQFNILGGITSNEFEAMVSSGFGLYSSNDASNYYRRHDLSQLAKVSKLFANNRDVANSNYTFAEFYDMLSNDMQDLIMDREGKEHSVFGESLRDFGSYVPFNTNTGLDIEEAIKNGDIIYVVGSRDLPTIKTAQKMLFIRIKQIKERLGKNSPHTTFYLDELKYFMCRPLLQAVGTIADKGCNFIFNFQDISNLRDTSENAPEVAPNSAESEILGNCSLNLIYRVNHNDTRKWASDMTGTKPVYSDSYQVESTESMNILHNTDRQSFREVNQNKFTPNVFGALGKKCGIMVGIGKPSRIFTSFVRVTQNPNVRKVVAYESVMNQDRIIDDDIQVSSLSDGCAIEMNETNVRSFGDKVFYAEFPEETLPKYKLELLPKFRKSSFSNYKSNNDSYIIEISGVSEKEPEFHLISFLHELAMHTNNLLVVDTNGGYDDNFYKLLIIFVRRAIKMGHLDKDNVLSYDRKDIRQGISKVGDL